VKGRRNPFVASEGIPYVLLSGAAFVGCWHFLGFVSGIGPLAVGIYFYLIFRDPIRPVPAVPLGVVSPVDGHVVAIGRASKADQGNDGHRIIIRVNSLGTYTARCPVEGKIMDLSSAVAEGRRLLDTNGLWVRTDEGDDVILQFSGHRFGLAPRAFLQYGERIGQGQRCAYLRLTRLAEVELPLGARILVEEGQRVVAGSDVLAKLPHH
jgi:phosphatidylserine decarboxylase